MILSSDMIILTGFISLAFFIFGLAAGRISGRGSAMKISTEEISLLRSALAVSESSLSAKSSEIVSLSEKLEEMRHKYHEVSQSLSATRAEIEAAIRQNALMKEDRDRLSDSFKALSSEIFRETSRSFMDLAGQTLSRYMDSARAEFDKRDKAVEGMIKPVKDALDRFDASGKVLETERSKAYGGLSEQVTALAKSQQALEKETAKLVKALRQPHVRGRWGEMTLRRAAEMAGMSENCDFFEQVSGDVEEGKIRPDMLIRLPGGRNIIVDAKTPLSAYIDAIESENEEDRTARLKDHARQVQTHVMKLSQKTYWKQFSPTPEFVVLFIPGENFFSAALTQQPDLIETAAEKGVVLATPSTLISLLKTISYAWREDSVARSAKAVMEMGRELCERIQSVASHMNRLGKDLEKCSESYNQAVGSLERRVFVTARKFQNLGLSTVQMEEDSRRIDIKARLMDEVEDIQ